MDKWVKIYDTEALCDGVDNTVTRGVRGGVTVYVYRLDRRTGTWVQQREVNLYTLRGGIRRGVYKFM